jgi:hypothetical protein
MGLDKDYDNISEFFIYNEFPSYDDDYISLDNSICMILNITDYTRLKEYLSQNPGDSIVL